MEAIRREPRPNANGADPKVDPTLTSAWSFRRRHLAPSVVAVVPDPRIGFVRLCHRRSHRHPVPSSRLGLAAPGRSPSLPFPLHPAVPRPIFRYGLSLPAHPLRPKPSRLPPWRVAGENRPMAALLRVLLKRSPLRWTEILCESDLEDRADRCRHPDQV